MSLTPSLSPERATEIKVILCSKWQARRQEMKWGGCFFVKSGHFLNAGCIMYSISIFHFTFYLSRGAYAPNAPPCLRAWVGLSEE